MMPKAKRCPDQYGFDFAAPIPLRAEGSLGGLEREVSGMVGSILNSDDRSRRVIAAQMSDLLGEDISSMMLDAYASPARPDHKVPFSRVLALVNVTNRQDLIDPILRRAIGGALLVGEEVHTAQLGQVQRQISELQKKANGLLEKAPAIRGSSDGE